MHTTPLDADSSFLTDAYIMKGLSGFIRMEGFSQIRNYGVWR